MSTFRVEIVQLDDVLPHPNADLLELAVIGGYRTVVQKGIHAPGDLVVYVPEAALLPVDIIEAFGFVGKLAGPAKNRVKAIRLRGELSQGLVLPLRRFFKVLASRGDGRVLYVRIGDSYPTAAREAAEFFVEEIDTEGNLIVTSTLYSGSGRGLEGMDLSALAGITKYEPLIPTHMQGVQRPRPEWFPMYTDIENIKKYDRVLEDGEEVVITEKLHGTSFACGVRMRDLGAAPDIDDIRFPEEDPEFYVSSRRVMLERDPHNLYWKVALENHLEVLTRWIMHEVGASSVILFGEIVGHGVQDLAYGTVPGEKEFRWFDLHIDGEYVDDDRAVELVSAAVLACDLPLRRVPVLYTGPFSMETVRLLTDGRTILRDAHLREGVVVKPVKERCTRSLGRVILKSISADYLTRNDGTEYH